MPHPTRNQAERIALSPTVATISSRLLGCAFAEGSAFRRTLRRDSEEENADADGSAAWSDADGSAALAPVRSFSW